jgi:septal ring factor EnvC (AmiA/AmiB activator)
VGARSEGRWQRVRGAVPWRIRAAAAGAVCWLVLWGLPQVAQAQTTGGSEQRLRQQQEALDQLRQERADLESEMQAIQRRTRTLTEELANLDAQRQATARLVGALDQQLETINAEVRVTGEGLANAEQELVRKRSVLHRRLVEIYKRGRLYDLEALLSAQSFAGLMARYKYLHELTLRDQGLVRRVEGLRDEIESQRVRLVRLQDDVLRNRAEKTREVARLALLGSQSQRDLVVVQRSETDARQRLTELARAEADIAGLIASRETVRLRAELAPNARPAAVSSLRPVDRGQLEWPVAGSILYRFGRVINPNRTTTRWNGIGIGASVGTAVQAIAAGEVVHADKMRTYGPTVIVQHGGGDYSVYGSLARIAVRKGQQIPKGETIGSVGAIDPELPPHLHFELRPQGRSVDPLTWLRRPR